MALDPRTHQLISVGVSIAINSQPGLDFHLKKSREVGVSEKEMAEAVRIARDIKLMASVQLLEHAGKTLQEELLPFSGLKQTGMVRGDCC
jgi:AhpD family alkylhydroperoxidase